MQHAMGNISGGEAFQEQREIMTILALRHSRSSLALKSGKYDQYADTPAIAIQDSFLYTSIIIKA